MMETEVSLESRPLKITHDSTLSTEGWVLTWSESGQSPFEIVCRTENKPQVAHLQELLNDGYRKAISHLHNN